MDRMQMTTRLSFGALHSRVRASGSVGMRTSSAAWRVRALGVAAGSSRPLIQEGLRGSGGSVLGSGNALPLWLTLGLGSERKLYVGRRTDVGRAWGRRSSTLER